ncbi:MAG: peptidoglycan DD-metalloendopeptidase family protein [Candidatus Paceibacterota bacterium]|jgi:LysM repeat protein
MVLLLAFNLVSIFPITANAGFISFVTDLLSGNSQGTDEIVEVNSQNVQLLTSAVNFDLNAAVGGGDISTTDGGEALVSESGPSGTLADVLDTVSTGQISTYTVRKGDNLASIAKMYGVTTNTIVWANDLTSATIKEGQDLIILPVSGTIHTVVKGDTLKSIAKKYKADEGEIAQFNEFDSNTVLAVGDTIVIPDGEGTTKISGTTKTVFKANPYKGGSGADLGDYYIRPVLGGVRTQNIHGYNAVDIGIPTGSTLHAAAAGQVILAKASGYNGGYGKYIIISHYNGTQTVYGHLSAVNVNAGDLVYQGQIIGRTGNTGHSTGPHLHFEVRGALNPLSK